MEEERNIWLNLSDKQVDTLENIWAADTKHMTTILQPLGLRGEKVIDVACGTGAYYPFLSRRYTKYIGVDTSGKMLSKARKRYHKVEFTLGDAKHLNYDDQTFDLVFCMSLLIHMPLKTIEKVFGELWRVSRKNVVFNLHITDSKTDACVGRWGEYISIINRSDINRLIDSCAPKNTKEITYGSVTPLSSVVCSNYEEWRAWHALPMRLRWAYFQGHLFKLEK